MLLGLAFDDGEEAFAVHLWWDFSACGLDEGGEDVAVLGDGFCGEGCVVGGWEFYDAGGADSPVVSGPFSAGHACAVFV